jgi:hypothetical protein
LPAGIRRFTSSKKFSNNVTFTLFTLFTFGTFTYAPRGVIIVAAGDPRPRKRWRAGAEEGAWRKRK